MKRMISMVAFCLPLFVFVSCSESHAQSLEDIKMQMIKDWKRAKSYTIDCLNTMPEEKYSFKAVDSIRSFAQQMLHLSNGNCLLMSNATDQKPPSFFQSDLEHSLTAQTKDSVMYYVTTSYHYDSNRQIYMTPSQTNEFPKSGGGIKFMAVIKNEIMAVINSNYRTDKVNSTLSGGSLSSRFILYTMFQKPRLFNRYIAWGFSSTEEIFKCGKIIFKKQS